MPKLKNQKGFAHIFVILVLLVGIIAGLYLVQHPQIFKPKASNEQISPLLQAERINGLRTKFKVDEQVGDDQVEAVVKDDFFQKGILVDGELIKGEATISVLGDCLNDEQTNYQLSEMGIYPPLCLDEAKENKAVEFLKSGVEFSADFFIPYTQAKEALNLGDQIAEVRSLLKTSGLDQRISTSSVSNSDSFFDGYAVTLIRIHELEQDVAQNPDGSDKLTPQQEQARREYAVALRDLWEKQHNLLLDLSKGAALIVIDRPLKIIGTAAKPFIGPIASDFSKTIQPALKPIYNFIRHTWRKAAGRIPKNLLELQEELTSRAYKVDLNVTDIPRPKRSNVIDTAAAERWIEAHPEGVARDSARAIVAETRHISQEEFESALKQTVAKFEQDLGVVEDYAIFVEPKKSNQWVAEMAITDMVGSGKLPDQVYDMGRLTLSDKAFKDIANYKRLVFFDDAVYSGSQMAININTTVNIAKSFGANTENLTIDVVVPFTTQYGKQYILDVIKQYRPYIKINFYETEIMPSATESLSKHGDEVVQYASRLYGGTENKTLTYFEHKIPDSVSTFFDAYVGFVHDSAGHIIDSAGNPVINSRNVNAIQIPFIPETIPPYK